MSGAPETLRLRAMESADRAGCEELLAELGAPPGFDPDMHDAETHGAFFVVERCADGAPLGLVQLRHEPAVAQVEVGFATRREERGKGVAKRATALALRLAFEEWGALLAIARAADENSASRAVLAHLGFRREGAAEGRGLYVRGRFGPPGPIAGGGVEDPVEAP